jgi:hypothetical protein
VIVKTSGNASIEHAVTLAAVATSSTTAAIPEALLAMTAGVDAIATRRALRVAPPSVTGVIVVIVATALERIESVESGHLPLQMKRKRKRLCTLVARRVRLRRSNCGVGTNYEISIFGRYGQCQFVTSRNPLLITQNMN